MGSPGDDDCNKRIDVSVGGLVWVRRRNGSWWPGKILSPDELPEGCVPMPRSGTPVKLLGREDASVDWYNLEKSKRVKAFRCREYAHFIEKAKAAASNSSKKTVKYARRDDAILHALEIESARLGKDHPTLSTKTDREEYNHYAVDDETLPSSSDPDDEETCEDTDSDFTSPGDSDDDEDDDLDSDSALELSQSGLSFEGPDQVDASKGQNRNFIDLIDSEDEEMGAKRMKGLEDFGLGVLPLQKRKRTQVAHVHEYLKRKHRRLTLNQVLENTVMVSVPVADGSGASAPEVSDGKVVSELESNESKKNSSDCTGDLNENEMLMGGSAEPVADDVVICKQKEVEISSLVGSAAEKLFEVPLVSAAKHPSGFSAIAASSVHHKPQLGAGGQSSQSSLVEPASLGAAEEPNESGSISSGAADPANPGHILETATEWQLKGKRKSRPRKVDINVKPKEHAVTARSGGSCILNSFKKHPVKSRPISEIQVDELSGWARNISPLKEPGPKTEMPGPAKLLPYRQSRLTVNPKYESFDFSLKRHNTDSGLFDIPIDVKTSYRPQHVPYISLMSKLTGRPVVGHPITVDVVADGSAAPECYSSSSELGCKGVQNVMSLGLVGVKRGRGRPPRKVQLGGLGLPQMKMKARRNGPLCPKIRKLSSLTGPGSGRPFEEKKLVLGRVNKSIPCVPLKVVFSRINASLK